MKSALEFHHISKRFNIGATQASYLSLQERMKSIFKPAARTEEFWALNDISFSVAAGESIGIIGRNGAGKSTLLKILSRITPPTKGRIIQRGRVASLLEVGTGFHPELTGRENIFFNGSLLGMKKKEIQSRFSEIVEFSGTETFVDTPLKHFSSGMQLRLAFSVAAFLEPEILVIDEVLAVGDAEFQKKCLGKMEDVSKGGRTIIFVSHNMAAVGNLCKKGVLMDKGKMVFEGNTDEAIMRYQQSFASVNNVTWSPVETPSSAAFFQSVSATLLGDQPQHLLRIQTTITSQAPHKDLFIAYDITNSLGITICQAIPRLAPFIKYSSREQVLQVEIELPPLIPDQYRISIWLGSHNVETVIWEKEIVGFEITESPSEGRNFPHSHANGFMVPISRLVYD